MPINSIRYKSRALIFTGTIQVMTLVNIVHEMKQVVLCLLISAIGADKLQSSYLPPAHASSSGGGNFLAPPVTSFKHTEPSRFEGASSYIPPASGPVPSAKLNIQPFQSSSPNVAILRFASENNGDGSYTFDYQTENQINQQERGQIRNIGTDQEASVVEGSYSYIGPDGATYTVNYVADENGFRASGDHIPTPPPIPAAILKSLENIPTASQFSSAKSHDAEASGQFHPQTLNKQYLAPSANSFSSDNGYHY